MLTQRELATLRAALRFWNEEMVPNHADFMRPYFGADSTRPLSPSQHVDLLAQLEQVQLQYAVYDSETQQLTDCKLLSTPPRHPRSQRQQIVAVLLP